MDQVRQQVARVRRRLLLQKFGRVFSWTLFLCMCLAWLGLAIPKVWAIAIAPDVWQMGWIAGAAGLSLVIAGIITWISAPSLNDSAIVIDQRFGLKERLSSSLSLSEEELDTEIGKALVADASRRADKLDVSEQFAHRARRIGLLPAIPLVFMAVLIFIPDATRDNEANAGVETAAEKQIKTAANELKKKLQLRRKRAEAKGLKDAGDLFKKIESDLDQLAKKSGMDQKKAMIALNDIKKQLQERRDKMGSNEELRKQMSNLKNMERGPADKLGRALEKGEMGKAQQEIKKLMAELKDGMITPQQQKQLEKQISQMQQAMQKAIDAHKKKKEELQKKMDQLKKQISEAKANNNNAEAQKLQKQLEKMQQQMSQAQSQDSQMQQMQQMADGLGKAMDAMKKGNAGEAADALSQLSEQLGEMQNEMDQLEAMMDQLSQTKQQMRCKGCNGMGCKQCLGNMFGQGMGQGKGQGMGDGLGEGNGYGDRPEEEDDTNSYESQVRDQPRNGNGIASGFANGPNRKGITREELKDVVLSALQDEKDPLEDRPLPRVERQHTEDYFNQLRELTE